MRLVRLGDETSTIGADVRAALASWGRGGAVVGGIALVGCRPPDCPEPVEAVVILPRGLLVVIGVDLPDPAMRMDAPVDGPWRIDGWPLVREDGAVNPAVEGLNAAAAVAARLQAQRVEPMPVGTVIAVGPYVARVSQPTTDLARGIRIMHPEPKTLLNAARELAVYERRCPVHQANVIVAALAPDLPPFTPEELADEGFEVAAGPDMSAASTLLIPRVPPEAALPAAPSPRLGGGTYRWVPVVAMAALAVLLMTAIVAGLASTGDSSGSASGGPAGPGPTGSQATRSQVIDGVTFTPKGLLNDNDCARRAIGDIQVWLQQHPCSSLVRSRYETTVKQDAAVFIADIVFANDATAGDFLKVANTTGTGTLVDASTEGMPWPGNRRPIFDAAAYATKRIDSRVRIAQVAWFDKASTPTDPVLQTTARQALELPAP
ncbi:hypothetical protein [Actinocrispum wychmicini]|uniref:Uncharacterized protein n=1 Tax=Actinocrispum wychmicini TaxID=1213861 RepID=A0A4R2IRZ6_9PSEU|nr:hypothetical protein [Actinocrispum wychmicini]TCO47954.1 hypothetical protein EV192_1166 [Actinocrispum wychmicini]